MARVVSADPGALVPHRLRLFLLATGERRLVGLGESYPAAALPPASFEQLLLDGRRNLNLEIKQVSYRIRIDTVFHRLVKVE